MPMQYKLLPLLLFTSALLVGGCKRAKIVANSPVENWPVESDASTKEAPKLLKADYWKPMASYVAGSYTGRCKRTAGRAKVEPATMLIGADGTYTFKEFSGDLHSTSMAMLSRKHKTEGSSHLNFSALWEDGLLGLSTDMNGDGYKIDFAKFPKKEVMDVSNTFGCDPSKGTLPIAGKALHIIFASVMEAAQGKLSCVAPGSTRAILASYKFKDGVFNVASHVFDITKMDEIVSIGESFTQFLYTATLKGNESITLGLDQYGQVMGVMTTGKEFKTISCRRI